MRFDPLLVLVLWLPAGSALAGWSVNLGYQNPATATYGLNFLYAGASLGFEAGIGWADLEASGSSSDTDEDADADKDGASVRLRGEIDGRYFFSGGGARPFLQAGIAVGLGARAGEDSGAGAGTGGGFFGAGLLAGSDSLYLYGSYNLGSGDSGFLQAGLGVGL